MSLQYNHYLLLAVFLICSTLYPFKKTKKIVSNSPCTFSLRLIYANKLPFLRSLCCEPESLALAIKKLQPFMNKPYQEPKEFSFMVKVLLAQAPHNQTVTWTIESKENLIIKTRHSETLGFWDSKKKSLMFRIKQGKVYLDTKELSNNYYVINANDGHFAFNGIWYKGFALVYLHNNSIYLINALNIEDYIGCVLSCESWPGWPLEINKAFAVACRSYLVAKVLESHKKKLPYHIKNSNIHQTYKGIHKNERILDAIDQTKGLILTYKKKPIEAMFDGCCGSIIPAHMEGINFKHAPYLERPYACTHCKRYKIFSWQVQYTLDELEHVLNGAGYSIKKIKEIKIAKRDKAGCVQRVSFIGDKNVLHLTGKQVYSLLSKIKSFCYSVEKRGKHIVFNGRGYGHHLGICQWGARNMIEKGFSYQAILSFYYPYTSIMELKNVSV